MYSRWLGRTRGDFIAFSIWCAHPSPPAAAGSRHISLDAPVHHHLRVTSRAHDLIFFWLKEVRMSVGNISADSSASFYSL